jgi:hypothetical protein
MACQRSLDGIEQRTDGRIGHAVVRRGGLAMVLLALLGVTVLTRARRGRRALPNVNYQRVVVADGHAYVGAFNQNVLPILTLVNPDQSSQASRYNANPLIDWAVGGNHAYVSATYRFDNLHVRDPTRPRQVGSAVMAQVRLPAVPWSTPVGEEGTWRSWYAPDVGSRRRRYSSPVAWVSRDASAAVTAPARSAPATKRA